MSFGKDEAGAKLALLEYLRQEKKISRSAAIAVELGIARQANRVDLALISDKIHFFEIKTNADNLSRLDGQIESYQRCAHTVSILVASKHLSVAMSRVGAHVGIYELVGFDSESPIREVREALASPYTDTEYLLDILPVAVIRDRLLDVRGAIRRAEAVEIANQLEQSKIEVAVRHFLQERYGTSTRNFLRATRRRKIKVGDLDHFKVWGNPALFQSFDEPVAGNDIEDIDRQIFGAIGSSFGPVPKEIKDLLKD